MEVILEAEREGTANGDCEDEVGVDAHLFSIIIQNRANVTLFYHKQPVERGHQRADCGPRLPIVQGGVRRVVPGEGDMERQLLDAELAPEVAKRGEREVHKAQDAI